MAQGSRNYTAQRNYYYESHDADGNWNGLTEDAWKQMILQDWTCANLKANYVFLIFHDKDPNEDGTGLKPLHVHADINFINTMSQDNAVRITKCSCDKNCTAINDKADSAKYKLHITEKAIKDKKHIYGED